MQRNSVYIKQTSGKSICVRLGVASNFLKTKTPLTRDRDPYGHHINLKSLKTSMTLKFVIILQNLKRIIEKVVRVNMTVN